MVYESDFYTTRRYRPSPSLSTYTVSTPRYYVVNDAPDARRAEQQYSYSYSSTTERSSGDPYSRPSARSYSTSERVSRTSSGGPGGYSYSTESTSRNRGDGPGGYQSSYSSTTSGRLPGGTSYRHYSYRYLPSKQVRLLPGIGKVHVVHTYDRIVPYVGHKRLTVVSAPPHIFKVRPSVLLKEFDRIQYKYRPAISFSYVNNYLNSAPSLRISYNSNPYLGHNRTYTTVGDVYYHKLVNRPSRAYYDILGSPRWSRYWYRYWYDIPRKHYLDYYDVDVNRWYSNHWSPYINWYPSLNSWYNNCVSPYSYKYLPSYDLPSNYWYWRSAWSRYYDLLTFNDETSRIKAEAASLLKRIHAPIIKTTLPLLPYTVRYSEPINMPRITSDDYSRVYKLFNTSPYNAKITYTTYYADPIKKFVGPGHLAAVRYSGGKGYGRRPNIRTYEDPVKDDIQLLSYYITRFREEKAIRSKEAVTAPLSPARPSRVFTLAKPIPEPEKKEELPADRAALRLARIEASNVEVEEKLKQKKLEARKAEEKAIAEEATKKKAQAEKEEAARKAELVRQEELAAQAAAERAAELERKAEQARQEELAKQAELERIRLEEEKLAKQAEIERIRKEEEERARLEEERRLAEEAKAEEERQQLLRLEEIARQAEEERERELARQAEELAELARQEAELEEQARKEAEAAEQAKREDELAELAKQEAELQELERQEKELAELARQEAELAELAKQEADIAKREAEIADLVTQEAELEGLKEKQEAELSALAAEAKALGDEDEAQEGDTAAPEEEAAEEEEEEEEE